MSYQYERDVFVATMTREGLPLHIIEALLRAATGFQRRAELACSSEAADRDRVPCPRAVAERRYACKPLATATAMFAKYPCLCDDYRNGQHQTIPRIALQDWREEERLKKLLMSVDGWRLVTAGDPRGCVLAVIPPSYIAENARRSIHNPHTIGVPTR